MNDTSKIFDVDISTIKHDPENCEKVDSAEVDKLAESIKRDGQQTPIILDKDGIIRGGNHRLAACVKNGKKTIRAIYTDSSDPLAIEILDNLLRRTIKIKERYSYIKRLRTKCVELKRAGKPQPIDKGEDIKFPTGENLFTAAIRLGICTNKNDYYRTITLVETGVPNLISAYDKGIYSLHAAADLAALSPKEQEKRLISDENIRVLSLQEATAASISRRAKKKLHKKGLPEKFHADKDYGLVRIAPDWANEKPDDIHSLPVLDFLDPKGVLCLECSNNRVGDAVHALDAWGLVFAGIITAYNPKEGKQKDRTLLTQFSSHIVLGKFDSSEIQIDTIPTEPVLNRQNHKDALMDIMSDLVGVKTPKLDMTSREALPGWEICREPEKK